MVLLNPLIYNNDFFFKQKTKQKHSLQDNIRSDLYFILLKFQNTFVDIDL